LRKSIVYEIKTMINRKAFCISFVAVLLFSFASFVIAVLNNWGAEWSNVFSADDQFVGNAFSGLWEFFGYVFAFMIVLPHAMSYLGDIESGAYSLAVVRAGKLRYFLSKLAATFVGNFLIIALPFLINLLLCHLAFSGKPNFSFGEYGMPNYFRTLMGTNFILPLEQSQIPFLHIFLISPTLYSLLYTAIISCVSGLLGVFVLCLSFFVRKRALLFIPVYLLILFSSVVTEYNYSASLSNPGRVFVNYDFMDYLGTHGYPGQISRYPAILFLVLVIFCVLATCWAIRNDQLITGKHDEK